MFGWLKQVLAIEATKVRLEPQTQEPVDDCGDEPYIGSDPIQMYRHLKGER